MITTRFPLIFSSYLSFNKHFIFNFVFFHQLMNFAETSHKINSCLTPHKRFKPRGKTAGRHRVLCLHFLTRSIILTARVLTALAHSLAVQIKLFLQPCKLTYLG
jgi:hypothetical protein